MSKYRTLEGTLFLDRNDNEIAVAVTGTYVPGCPGTREDPPERSCVEDVCASVKGEPFELTDKEIEQVEEMLLREFADSQS